MQAHLTRRISMLLISPLLIVTFLSGCEIFEEMEQPASYQRNKEAYEKRLSELEPVSARVFVREGIAQELPFSQGVYFGWSWRYQDPPALVRILDSYEWRFRVVSERIKSKLAPPIKLLLIDRDASTGKTYSFSEEVESFFESLGFKCVGQDEDVLYDYYKLDAGFIPYQVGKNETEWLLKRVILYDEHDRKLAEVSGYHPWGDTGCFLLLCKLIKKEISLKSDIYELLLTAEEHVAMGNDRKAIEFYSEALDYESKLTTALTRRAEAFLRLGEIERAIEDANKMVDMNPTEADAYLIRAKIFYRACKFDEALNDFNTALNIKPKLKYAMIGRGWTFLEKKEIDRASEDFAMALAVTPPGETPKGYLGVDIKEVPAELAQSLGLKDENKGALVSSVSKGTPAEKAGILAGDIILEFDGEQVKASEDLENHIHATPPGKQVQIKLIREGQEKVVGAVLGVLPPRPDPFAWIGKAWVVIHKGDYEYAIRILEWEKVTAYIDLDHLRLRALGYAYKMAGEKEKAQNCLARALETYQKRKEPFYQKKAQEIEQWLKELE